MLTVENIENCIGLTIASIIEHADLMQRAINEPNNRVIIANLLQQSSDRRIALDIECNNDSNDVEDDIVNNYLKSHPEVADPLAEAMGRAATLEIKLRHRLDKNIPEDAKLDKVVDLWGDHDPSAWDNI